MALEIDQLVKSWQSNLAPKQPVSQDAMYLWNTVYTNLQLQFQVSRFTGQSIKHKTYKRCRMKIKTSVKTLPKTQAVALRPDAEHASWLVKMSLKNLRASHSLFVVCSVSQILGIVVLLLLPRPKLFLQREALILGNKFDHILRRMTSQCV